MEIIILNKIKNRRYFNGILLFIVAMISSCNDFNPKRLDGWKDLYIFNCSGDVVTIETSLMSIEKEMFGFYHSGPYQSEPLDTVSLKERIHFYQWLFKTKNYKEIDDSLLIILEPQEGMRIINLEWLIAPTKFREWDLNIDNLKIITKSDTISARSRKEILELRFSKDCKDGIYFKTIKYGRHGEPIMNEKVWKGR